MLYKLLYAFVCVFLAGIVRGLSGFGFALLVIVSVSLVLPPATIVPAMIVLEVVAGIHLLPSIWKSIHWHTINVMVVAAVLCTPIGVYLLTNVPAEPMKFSVAVLVLFAAILLMTGVQMRRMPTTMETAVTGATAGVLNGALGLGGPPIIVFFLGSPLALEAGRASIIATFLAIDIAALPALFIFKLFNQDSIKLLVFSLPALLAGVFIGSQLVNRINQIAARKIVLIVLLIMAAASAARSLFLLTEAS